MNDIAIRVEHLSKEYRIGRLRPGLTTLRETLSRRPAGAVPPGAAPARRRPGHRRPRDDRIWALQDVSFEVKHGEVIGIIGGNGAGKSTLLKILSRITEPTDGRRQHPRPRRVAPGGRHRLPPRADRPRERLSSTAPSSACGVAEIAASFDEIVAFAEIEQFIDTPVKHYSTGMYLRLAFAVAAHLEPEILIVDEVLAVGDQAFQSEVPGEDRGAQPRRAAPSSSSATTWRPSSGSAPAACSSAGASWSPRARRRTSSPSTTRPPSI